MASEKERAREEYLRIREQALKADRKGRLAKVWTDTHYLLCGGAIIAAVILLVSNWTDLSGGSRWMWVAVSVVAVGAFIALGSIPTRKMLRHKKELHDLQQKLEDLESRYHL